jgi:nucleoside-diphosphate-sugar epimerase
MTNSAPTKHQGHVVILGASGFVGQYVVHALNGKGLRTVAVPREALVHDLADAISGAEVVVNLAAAGVSPKVATADELQQVNAALPARLVEVMATNDVPYLVMAGTAAEYGSSADRYERIPPDAPLGPMSDYARSKVEGFEALVGASLRSGVTVDYLRVFNAFGPGQSRSALWPALEHAARSGDDFPLSSGRQVRDFIPVEEVADEFARTVLARIASGPRAAESGSLHVRNIGTGQGVSVREFATRWWEHWGGRGELVFGALEDRTTEPQRLVADATRVHRITNDA